MPTYIYLNGQIIATTDAHVSPFDVGLLRGFGIYEAMTTFNDKIFMYADHMARFRKSVEFLHMHVPISDSDIEKVIFELIEKNGFNGKRVNIKFILTGGEAIGGIDFDPTTPTFYIFVEEWQAFDQKYYTDGARVITHEFLRQYASYKTTNYITATLLQKEMKASNALEILYTWQGNVLECATSNFFIVQNGVLITAKDNILSGVTRNVTIDIARKAGLEVQEREVTVAEMLNADECFLTSSFKDIIPVVNVGEQTIGDGKVGSTSQKVMSLWQDFVSTY
jgi:branched-chain amino acid aminotransferase